MSFYRIFTQVIHDDDLDEGDDNDFDDPISDSDNKKGFFCSLNCSIYSKNIYPQDSLFTSGQLLSICILSSRGNTYYGTSIN